MRLSLDTSVVLRIVTGDPRRLAVVAARRLEQALLRGDVVVVPDLVVAEAYYALQHHYGLTKSHAITTLRAFLDAAGVSGGSAREVLAQPGLASAKPGLVDRLIHADAAARADVMLTFERSAAKLAHVEVLKG